MSKAFTLGQVLTVTTGRLLCEVPDLYRILDYLTGDSLMTHQLPRAGEECAPYIVRLYPQFEGIQVPEWVKDEPTVKQWLAVMVKVLGPTFSFEPMPPENHTHIHPLTELRMNHPHLNVIPVVIDETDGGNQP